MKQWLLLCTFLLLVIYSTQIPTYENCTNDDVAKISKTACVRVNCLGPDSGIEMAGCDDIRCAIGAQTGFHTGNRSKPYPECCDYPICRI